MSNRILRRAVLAIVLALLLLPLALPLAADPQPAGSKISSLLDLQVKEKSRHLDRGGQTEGDEVVSPRVAGIPLEQVAIQKVFIHSKRRPTSAQLADLQSIGVTAYADSWIPPIANHPTGFIYAEMPIEKLNEVAVRDYVVSLETAEQSVKLQNDYARQATGVNSVWASGYTGTGVTVAVIDSGLDLTHADVPVPVGKKDYSNYPALGDNIANTITGHGTHVTGVAVGRGTLYTGQFSSGKYKGVAPGADLVFLKIGKDDGRISYSAEVAAIKAAVDAYETKVINLSVGAWSIYHDGSSENSQAADYAASKGAVFVAAAGNEANKGLHYSGTVNGNGATDLIKVNVKSAGTSNTALAFNLVWFDGVGVHNDLTLEYYHALGNLQNSMSSAQSESPRGTESRYSSMAAYVPEGYSSWYLKVRNNSNATQPFHLYYDDGYNKSGAGTVAFDAPDPNYTIVSPAEADTAIAVGAYVTRQAWANYEGKTYRFQPDETPESIATFSSQGPRVDPGAPGKPNIVAPGSAIISLRDSVAYPWPPSSSYAPAVIDNDGTNNSLGPANYYVMQGTSTASPHAAGIAALLLSYIPSLTPAQVRSYLETSARDKGTSGWDSTYGWGLVNALEALRAMPPPTPTPTPPPTPTPTLPPRPTAAFSASVTSGLAPLTVNFTDSSTSDILAWRWDFNGDGTVDSTARNPSYTYSAPGNYTVKLTVSNVMGSDEEVKVDYIKVYVAPVAAFSAGGFEPLVPWPTSYDLSGVWGTGPDNVFAVGAGGTILHYDGMTWLPMKSGTRELLMDVWGTGTNDIFAVGTNGTILRFNGIAWSAMNSGTSSLLYALWGTASNHVFAVGVGVIVFFDGNSWTKVANPNNTYLTDVWGTGPDNVYVVGWTTTDFRGIAMRWNGISWTTTDLGTNLQLDAVWGSGSSDVYAAADRTLMHYDGSSWSVMFADLGFRVGGIWGTAANNVFVAGADGNIRRYKGTAWYYMLVPQNTYQQISAVWGSGPSDVFAVGQHGTILHYNGNTTGNAFQGAWSPMSRYTTGPDVIGIPEDIWGSNAEDVFVAAGGIAHYDGMTWSRMATNAGIVSFEGIWGSGPNDVFAVGSPGYISRYNGTIWSAMDSGTTMGLFDVWGSGPNDVYTVGAKGTILHYDGSAWSPMSSGTTAGLEGVWGSGPNDVYAVGGNGTILHYNGSTWSSMSSGTTSSVYGVWGSGPNDVYAVGYFGTILHYNGAVWSSINSGTLETLMDVGGSGPNDIYVVGYPGIIHFDGSNWAPLDSGYTYVYGVWANGLNDAFFAAVPGAVLRYRGPTSGLAPLTLTFVEASIGNVVSWAWDFDNDGTADSTARNPSYTYSAPGNYSVRLTVTNPAGSDEEVKPDTVKVYAPPTAGFTASVTSGLAPLRVTFSDASTGNIVSWAWDFENDGTVDSTERDPTHIYSVPGNYTVRLSVSNAAGSHEAVKVDYIRAYMPVAAFSASSTSGLAPLTVSFADASTGNVTSWAWDFEADGIVDSIEQNPTHTYLAPGNYTVKLALSTPVGSDDEVKTNYVKVYSAPTADFSASPTSGLAPLTVSFADTSFGNITSWAWDFDNDGVVDSTEQNPTHIYTAPGSYTVKLTVTNPAGSDDEVKAGYIIAYVPPTAAFSADVTSGLAPLTVSFSDASTGTIARWSWSFGDGGVSDQQNPTHKYRQGGRFTVSLTVFGPGGSDSEVKTELVNVLRVDFAVSPQAGGPPLTVQFTDTSVGPGGSIGGWLWDFGDGAASTEQHPSHTYAYAGAYTVSLTASDAEYSLQGTETKPGYVKVAERVVETGLGQEVGGDNVARIPVSVTRARDTASGEAVAIAGGIAGYHATAIFDSDGIQMLDVAGAAPFTSPSKDLTAPGQAVFNASHTEAAGPESGTVAYLVPRLVGSATDAYDLVVRFDQVTDVATGAVLYQDAATVKSYRRGDVNGDGVVSIVDALFIAQYLAKLRTLDTINLVNAASVMHDLAAAGDKVTITDALFIAQYKALLRDSKYDLTGLPPPAPPPPPAGGGGGGAGGGGG